jgi:UDP-N-acetylmuramyl pentapeptide phosphotransferase/UDP-N-acetylglucosamine-1-phosphate transferase
MGRALGVIDYPDGGRKSHARPTPMVGGIALMVPLLLVALVEASRSSGGSTSNPGSACWSRLPCSALRFSWSRASS